MPLNDRDAPEVDEPRVWPMRLATGITLIDDVEVGSLRSSTAAAGCEVPL